MVDVDAPVIFTSGAERVISFEGLKLIVFNPNDPEEARKREWLSDAVEKESVKEENWTREVEAQLTSKMVVAEVIDAMVFATADVSPFTSIAVVNSVLDVSAM